MPTKEVTVVLVEDDELDVDATIRAFRKAKIANDIVSAGDGKEALDYLRGENGKNRIEKPYIVLLDLNMPRMSGHEFLDEVRKDPALTDSVVFVLTTSDADRDRWSAYEKHVAGYILKSKVGDDFLQLITMLDQYWKIVELPS